jgi:hypothetical protein
MTLLSCRFQHRARRPSARLANFKVKYITACRRPLGRSPHDIHNDEGRDITSA